MRKLKEIHIIMNSIDTIHMNEPVEISYDTTLYKIKNTIKEVLYTTQLPFLSFKYAEKLFVVTNNIEYEITLGECYGTDLYITMDDNLPKLLTSGAFRWYNKKI